MDSHRYLLNFNPADLEIKTADLLIVGSGIAGLYTALKAGERKTIIITKEKTEDSSTDHAQGGIAAVISDKDSLQLHIEDTLIAGAGLCHDEAVKILVEEGPDCVRELIAMGTEFDRIENNLNLTREGAHSRRRILHARGDATGEEIRKSLVRNILHLDWIETYEDTYALDLFLGQGGECRGILAFDRPQGKLTLFSAPVTVMATGGCGQVFAHTSNPAVATGDGLAMAYRAGVMLMDMEFYQFHPTTLYSTEKDGFLISEAVRGEGGILRNKQKERFMSSYHPQGELAPRDIVSRAIFAEMIKSQTPFVYLDVTHLEADYLKKRFPKIYNRCLADGYDMTSDLVPVHPAAHYAMGGIKTDLNGATNIPGLFACGEVAATGVHGANRLASNSLLEGLVFGRRIARHIEQSDLPSEGQKEIPARVAKGKPTPLADNMSALRGKLQRLMTEQAGIIRDGKRLRHALREVDAMRQYLGYSYSKPYDWETQNLIQNAHNILLAALRRKESRGAHYRSDYPKQNFRWNKKHIVLQKRYKRGKKIVLS